MTRRPDGHTQSVNAITPVRYAGRQAPRANISAWTPRLTRAKSRVAGSAQKAATTAICGRSRSAEKANGRAGLREASSVVSVAVLIPTRVPTPVLHVNFSRRLSRRWLAAGVDHIVAMRHPCFLPNRVVVYIHICLY